MLNFINKHPFTITWWICVTSFIGYPLVFVLGMYYDNPMFIVYFAVTMVGSISVLSIVTIIIPCFKDLLKTAIKLDKERPDAEIGR